MKKLIAVILSALMLISAFSGCGNPTENASSNASSVSSGSGGAGATSNVASSFDRSVTMGIPADPGGWATWAGFSQGRRDTFPFIYQGLTADFMDPVKNIMTTYNVMITGYDKVRENTYEIHLREGIYDTAGNPFTASDAIFSFNGATKASTGSSTSIIANMELIDDLTFRMTTIGGLSAGEFDNLLTETYMVTQAAYEASSDGMGTNPVGTTGYVLTEYVSGSHCTFMKSDIGYWNEAANQSESVEDGYCAMYDTTNLDIVTFNFITDASTLAIALETGAVDIATNVSSNDVALFRDGGQHADKFHVNTYADTQNLLSFNSSDQSVMNNTNLRKAIAYCFDSAALLDAAYNGDGMISKAWAYPGMKDYQKSWDTQDYFDYNLEKAQEYLNKYYEETDTTAADLHIRLLTYNRKVMESIAETLQAYIGLLVGNPNACEILDYEQSTFNELRLDPSAFDMYIGFAVNSRTYPINTWYAACINRSAIGYNQFFVEDAKLEELCRAAAGENTHSDATVVAFQEYVNEQCYIVGLATGYVYIVSADWIESFMIGRGNSVCIGAFDYNWDAKAAR